jgi:arsenate reductase
MAEAILRHLGEGAIAVESAGTLPQPAIHPMARRAVSKLLELEMDGQSPKTLDRFLGQDFDYVVTVCDHAAASCPMFPGDPQRIHWNVEDPAAVIGTADEKQRAFDNTAAHLLSRIRRWVSSPALHQRIHPTINCQEAGSSSNRRPGESDPSEDAFVGHEWA